MSRRELRAARLAEVERGHDVASGERFADVPREGTGSAVDAIQGNVEAKCGIPNRSTQSTESRTAHHSGVADAPTTIEQLRDAPITAHPLRVYLVQRGITHEQAAKIFGVSARAVEKWTGWESRPSPRRGAEIARLLGFGDEPTSDEILFPRRPGKNDEE